MAKLVDKKVAGNISAHSIELELKKGKLNLRSILSDFEKRLRDNPKTVVTLSPGVFSKLNKFIQQENDESLTNRFQAACNESIKRANKLSNNKHSESENDAPGAPHKISS